jgi:hypothetical protein
MRAPSSRLQEKKMPTATADNFDLDIRLAAPDPRDIPGPVMISASNPHSQPCCSEACTSRFTCP